MQREINMKRVLLLIVGFAALTSASAQMLPPIDTAKRADDINHKFVRPPTVEKKIIAPDRVTVPRSPLSDQRRGFGRVETSTVATPTVATTSLVQPILPHLNFVAKRAAGSENLLDEKRIARKKAPVKDTVIRTSTPAGREELKQILNQSQ